MKSIINDKVVLTQDCTSAMTAEKVSISPRNPLLCNGLQEGCTLRVNRNDANYMISQCYGTHLLPFNLDFPLKTIGAVCHQFGLLSTDPQSYTL